MSNMTHDVIIIGSGPAGLTAGIYTARAGFRTLIIEGPLPGGQLMLTTNVENWPGQKSILGPDLMMGVREHAQQSGCEFLSGSVMRVNFSSREHELYCENNKKLECKSVIIATGSSPKKLLCPGENVYWGKGVSVCATCDAPFYKDKDVIVVGGGNSAVTEAEHLSRFARRVTIVHIGDKLTATDLIKEKVLRSNKIFIIYNSTVSEIKGDGQRVKSVTIKNIKNAKEESRETAGVFVAIGFAPNTEIFKDFLLYDKFGYLAIQEKTQTSTQGIFAAGDVVDYKYRQAIAASGMGCMAALDCQRYLSKSI